MVGKALGILVGLLLGITDGMFVELIDGGLVGNNDILNDGIFDTIEGRSLGILFGRLHDPHDFGQFSRNIFHVQYLLILFTSLNLFTKINVYLLSYAVSACLQSRKIN